MEIMNVAIMMGRLVADPELRRTTNDIAVCVFKIAVKRDYAKNNEADFITCVAWRDLGERIDRYFKKGKLILVRGSIQTRAYEHKGDKRTATELIVERFDFCGDKDQGSASVQFSIPETAQTETEAFSVVSSDDDLPF